MRVQFLRNKGSDLPNPKEKIINFTYDVVDSLSNTVKQSRRCYKIKQHL